MPSGLIKIFGLSARWEEYKRHIISIQKDYINPSENWQNYKGETQWESNKKEIHDSFFLNFIYLFIYLWLCWVFVSVRGLSPVVASRGHSSLRCARLSLSRPLLLRSTGSRHAGSVIVAHGPSCSAACGISPDHGSNPCPLHWQADSQPLRHQGSPMTLSELWFSQGICPVVGLLGHMVVLFLVF